MDEEDIKKLPLDERCVHKLWKARVSGYEEVAKLFRQIDDEKSPEFGKYLGLIKKFVVDGNVLGQEKGLEAAIAFVDNYAHAGKTVGEVMSGVVSKCLAASKARTRELALQLTLLYIEIEKQDAVMEELIKGLDQKSPKIISACVVAITTALREFGSKVIQLKPIVKKISVLFADRDKTVRDESRLMVIEMYKWIGAALKPQLSNLQQLQITELEAEFAKVEGQKAVPTRYLRSQQERQVNVLTTEAVDGENSGDNEEECDEAVAVDPFDLMDPVDILSKLPKDFYDLVEAKKWQERKEALEKLENLVKNPKLENGDYGDLVRALKKIIQKDSNVVVVALAAKCLNGLAQGLKKKFQMYAGHCVPVIYEKFKEKKQNVVLALREAIDSIYLSTHLEAILEDTLEALANKNPSVKSEVSLFLSRAFTKTLPTAINKKLLKSLTGGLIKLTNEPDATVRESASEALGTLMKLMGEKAVAPFLVDLEKDAKKMERIKEHYEKAVIVVKVPRAKKEVKAKPSVKEAPKSVKGNGPPKPVARKTMAAVAKPASANLGSATTATMVKSKGPKSTKLAAVKPTERLLSEEEVVEIAEEILPGDILSGLADVNWKTRLAAAESFLQEIESMDKSAMPVQALVHCICRKPGLKDTNFQVLKVRLDIIKQLANSDKFSSTSAGLCTNDVAEKLGDAKNGVLAAEVLSQISEATSLKEVSSEVLDFATTQKSPKVLQESLLWMAAAIKDFGFNDLNAKFIIDVAKKALASNNSMVRSAAISLTGVMYLFIGSSLHTFFENEKPALRDQIYQEFEKYENSKPPTPTRGAALKASPSSDGLCTEGEDDDGSGGSPAIKLQDVLPRTDISAQITESLINEMQDKDWKVRNEALTKVSAIITEARLIKPNIADLPQALALRLVDSNSKIAQFALTICENIATAMGPHCKQHVRTLFPGFLQGLGDSKAWIRSASVSCINTFGEQAGYKEFFEAEMIFDALKGGSPALKCELWAWLADKLPKIKQVPKEELIVCIPYLYANMEDRNAEVRKNANEAVLGVMMHVGYEKMVKQLEKLKPGSRTVIATALEKVRPNLPQKEPPPKKPNSEVKAVRGGKKSVSATKTIAKPRTSMSVAKPVARTKKDEDIDTSPLLTVNNLKQQRAIDESKLKILKWNFTNPRQEFVDLLRDQMTSANVNRNLVANMFHADFKYHIKALEALAEDLNDNSQALICNLDLILKWLTLRFFDTNPSVLLKGLEYLSSVFNMLIDCNYQLMETEAHSFIPYLITKIGDPKDSVRNGVRSLIKQLCEVYSVSKLFTTFLMEGLKSKNARQRAECLESMASIIGNYGLGICQPTPGACMKEVAKQLADRDNTVRNAALNCATQAYYIVGDKIFKMVGNISDKDMSLLEERIKRAGKKPQRPLQNQTITNIDLMQQLNITHVSQKENVERCDDVDEHEDDVYDDPEDLPEVALPSQVQQIPDPVMPEEANPYQLDPELIKQWDAISTPLPKVEPMDVDMTFLDEKIPTLDEIRAGTFENIPSKVSPVPLTPPKPIAANSTFSSNSGSAPPRSFVRPMKSPEILTLEKQIQMIRSSNYVSSSQGLIEVEELLRSSKSRLIEDYEDNLMAAICDQLKYLYTFDASNNATVVKVYRHILTTYDAFYAANEEYGRKVSAEVLKDLMIQFLQLLSNGKLDNVSNSDSYIRVLNTHSVKLIERSDHTRMICVLIQILYDCVKSMDTSKFADLVMKCLWRIIKIMSTWGDDMDYDSILYEVHVFFKEFPSASWKNKPSDTPIRTVKTVIHSLVKIKGSAITNHLSKVPNTNDSELESYILKLLKGFKLDEVKQVPLKMETRRNLPRTTQAQLTDIFQKIGKKTESKEGLNLLYDFLEQNPETEIDQFLQRSTPFFQEYIKKNLKEIKLERENNSSRSNDFEYFKKRLQLCREKYTNAVVLVQERSSRGCNSLETLGDNGFEKNVDYYKEQLKKWKLVCEAISKSSLRS